jgi:Fe-S cluster assembly iron-binding protein IscA
MRHVATYLSQKEIVMITITEAAGEHLATLLDNADAPQETAIRFIFEDNTVKSALDSARPGDTTFEHENRTVLLLDAAVSEALNASTLDVQPTDDGKSLVLHH